MVHDLNSLVLFAWGVRFTVLLFCLNSCILPSYKYAIDFGWLVFYISVVYGSGLQIRNLHSVLTLIVQFVNWESLGIEKLLCRLSWLLSEMF